jgi:CheY-like chemotaxis protein
VDLTADEAAAIAGAVAGQYVSLLVSDTGTGMPPEVKGRIFEPFFTTKDEGRGTGIGLSTVQRIVTAHSGFIRVESEPGQGTTFEILLPRSVDAPNAPMREPATAFARGNGELILIADDEQAIRELVSEGLTAHGYRVLSAANGAEALRLFEEHAGTVRLLLTDSSMPVMNGPQLIHRLRGLSAELPVIVASGEIGAAQTPGEVLPGDVVQLSKPFALEELLAAMARCLQGDSPIPPVSKLGND